MDIHVPDDLTDLIKELVIVEEEKKRKKENQEKELYERLYEELPTIEKSKPIKIEISLE